MPDFNPRLIEIVEELRAFFAAHSDTNRHVIKLHELRGRLMEACPHPTFEEKHYIVMTLDRPQAIWIKKLVQEMAEEATTLDQMSIVLEYFPAAKAWNGKRKQFLRRAIELHEGKDRAMLFEWLEAHDFL